MLDKVVYLANLVFLASSTFSIALMEISFGVALVGWLLLKRKGTSPLSFPGDRRMFISLLAFVFLSSISFFWSEFPKQSLRGVLKILQQFFIFWIVAETLIPLNRRETALCVLVFVFLFLGLDGVWQYGTGRDLLRQIPLERPAPGPRVSASFHNYGLLAAFIVSFWPLLASQWVGGEAVKKKGAWFLTALAAVFGGLLLFWTRSRGGWIALWAGLVFFLGLQRKKVLLGALILGTLLSLFLLPREMKLHLDMEGKDQSLIERLYLWDRGLQVIWARPWAGTGINTYAVAHQKYDRKHSWRVQNYYAHNGYIQIAAETGLPSLACFLAFLFFYFNNAFRFLVASPLEGEKRSLIGILAGMLGFLILGTNDTIFHNPQSILEFWFLAGWGAAVTSARSIEAGARA